MKNGHFFKGSHKPLLRGLTNRGIIPSIESWLPPAAGALGAALRRSCFTAAYALRCTSGRLAALSGAQPPAEASRSTTPEVTTSRGTWTWVWVIFLGEMIQFDLSLGHFLGEMIQFDLSLGGLFGDDFIAIWVIFLGEVMQFDFRLGDFLG